MPAADDGGADEGWVARLSRLLGAREEDTHATLAARSATDADRNVSDTALLDAVISGMPDPVAVLDQDGRVIAFNTEATALAPALRRGEPASIALRMPELVEAIRAASASGKAQRIEFSARLPSPRFSEAFISPVMLAQPGRAGIVVITVHDLTPIRRVEEMRADFVANVSHELRTPLAAITGFIDTLQGPARDDPAAHQRPDTPVDLVPIVRQIVDGLQTLARDRDVALEVAAPAEPLMVLGDRDELTRLFENLIENGLKYGASGKRVDIALAPVAASDGEDEARVSVRDYGPGIAAEHLPRLTERFYRVDVGESRAQGGTGLGLALVKHILNRHHGRLSIESREGEGATFTVRLSLSDGKSPLK
jgi:two-component system phosphate regulon sensor histidine kinase PhoR